MVKATPVTIADAYTAVTNEAIQQALAFANSHAQNYPTSLFAKSLQSLVKESGLNSVPLLTLSELADLQKLTMQRYQEMGRIFL